MQPDDVASFPTSRRRVKELAEILAAGVLRLSVRAAFPATYHTKAENPLDSVAQTLDVSPRTVLSVRAG